MPPKKGLSFDEKRKKMLEYFYEKRGVYRLKDLETGCSKEKGIVSQTVKEVLQSLVDDNLVDYDKIGAGNFYWALPSKASRTRKNQLTRLEEELTTLNQRKEEAANRKRKAQAEREASDERAMKLQRIAQQRAKLDELSQALTQFASCDPDTLNEMKTATDVCIAAANRWTDNISSIVAHFKEFRSDMDASQVHTHFGLPADLDYIS